jgi:predicted hotdog family 3-hydroxylacyl-ACP dehydratase
MIDEIVEVGENHTRTVFKITADNVLAENGFFTVGGLIENMAQTAGAGTGHKSITAGKPMPMGYIAALKNVQVTALPAINDTITTLAAFEQTLMNLHLVKGSVMVGGVEIANAEFKIFVDPVKPSAQ